MKGTSAQDYKEKRRLIMTKDNAIAFVNLGMIALYGGYDEEAAYSFKTALGISPNLVEAYIGLGIAYANVDRYAGMASAFRRAVKLNPPSIRKWAKSWLSGKPVLLSKSPEYAHITGEMVDFLYRLDEAEALVRLGAAHVAQGAYRSAVATLEYCLKLSPDYTTAIILLTAAYLLLEAKEGDISAEEGRRSVLTTMSPELAEELFARE